MWISSVPIVIVTMNVLFIVLCHGSETFLGVDCSLNHDSLRALFLAMIVLSVFSLFSVIAITIYCISNPCRKRKLLLAGIVSLMFFINCGTIVYMTSGV